MFQVRGALWKSWKQEGWMVWGDTMATFLPKFSAFLPMAIHTVNRIQVRRLSFIIRNTLMRILAPGVNGTRGTYTKIKLQSDSNHTTGLKYIFPFKLH